LSVSVSLIRAYYVLGCDALTEISNGSLNVAPGIYGNWSLGAVGEFSCITGFVLSHNMSLQCTENGRWNDTSPICEKRKCQPLSHPINGSIEPLNVTHTYLDEVRYNCAVGFNLIGPENRTCLSSGEWSEPEPHCQLVDCGNITAPVNGNVTGGEETTFGIEAFIHCSEGHRLNGSNVLKCNTDGTWSSQPPTCNAISIIIICVVLS